jgi:branched-chain amino acid transport system substrate-binding protein
MVAVAVAAAACLTVAACGGDNGAGGATGSSGGGGDYKIALLSSLTGTTAGFGQEQQTAIQLAVADINKTGIKGKQLKVEYEDNQLRPDTSVTLFQRLVGDGVKTFITSGSSVLLALGPLAQQQKAVVTNTAAQAGAIADQAGDKVFSTIPNSLREMDALAKSTIQCLGSKRAAVLQVDNDFGSGSGDAFAAAFKKYGGQVVARETFPIGATEYRNELRKIAGAKPDLLIPVANTGELGNIAAQNKQLGYNIPLAGGTFALGNGNYSIAKDAMDDMHIEAVSFKPQTAGAKAFAAAYEKKMGAPVSSFGAIAYDTTQILAKAFGTVGTEPDAVAKYLRELRGYQGIMGEYNMTLGKNNVADLAITPLVIKDSGKTLAPWDCKAS